MKNYFGGKWFNGQNNHLTVTTNLLNNFGLSQNPNFNDNVPGAPLSQSNYSNRQFMGASSSANQGFGTAITVQNLREGDYDLSPKAQQGIYNPIFNDVTQDTHFGDQGVDQYPAPGSFNPYQDQGTPTNPEDQTRQNSQNAGNPLTAQSQLNPAEHFSENFPVNEQVVSNLQIKIDENKRESLEAVLGLIENTKVGINEQRETDKEANISQNAQQLFHRTEELFYHYSTAAELEQNATKKIEWTKQAAEQLKEIQSNPFYSKEINNEPERRDACERAGRFIGETTSRVIGLGLGFGAAVAVASLMIPPAMVLYGPMIVAGPVVVAGAGGAAAFMANKLGYKIADITLSNTTALAGRLLDWSKNSLRDWWNKDKEQVKALTTLKNKLLQDIETAQLGFIEARNKNDQTQMTQHLENLYIKASVLKDLETSIVGQRQAEQKQKEALEEWKKTSLLNKAAKKIGESETWKSIRETTPRNICEKLGIITGKIVGLAIAAGLGAAAAIAITSSIGAAATILYGPMAVVGITAAAGITAGAVGYKIANPVATWSFKKVGYVADLAKNATYDVAKSMAVGTKNIVMGKGKHSDKEQAKKGSKIDQGKSR